eukprot:SAG31_NODE_1016_length_10365_cov_16.138418_9_plen_69_part_00
MAATLLRGSGNICGSLCGAGVAVSPVRHRVLYCSWTLYRCRAECGVNSQLLVAPKAFAHSQRRYVVRC